MKFLTRVPGPWMVLLTPWLSAAALAQVHDTAPIPPIGDQLLVSQEEDGSTWVRGRDYKAQISPEGLKFIPFLGSDAETTYPTLFSARALEVDGRVIQLPRPKSIERDGDRFTLTQGRVHVHYDATTESIEQLFEIDLRGLDVGDVDLRVIVDVETALAETNAPKGLRWGNGRGGIHYGEAFVVHADGGRASVETALVQRPMAAGAPSRAQGATSIELSVPSHELIGDTLWIDPLIRTDSFGHAGVKRTDPDVAYDRYQDAFAYVFEEQFAWDDHDVRMVLRKTWGQVIGEYAIDLTDSNWTEPSVANQANTKRAMIVAVLSDGASQPTEDFSRGTVMGRIFDHGTNTMGASFPVAIEHPSLEVSYSQPDIGGSDEVGHQVAFPVTYVRHHGAYAQPVVHVVKTPSILGGIFTLNPDPNHKCLEVAISKSAGHLGTVGRWNVAWIERDQIHDRDFVKTSQLDLSGAPIGPAATLYWGGANDRYRAIDVSDGIHVTGLQPTYLVSHLTQGDNAGNLVVFLVRDGEALDRKLPYLLEHAPRSPIRSSPCLGATADRFLLGYVEEAYDVEEASRRAVITTIDLANDTQMAVSERRVEIGRLSPSTSGNRQIAIATRASGGLLGSRFAGVIHELQDTGATDVRSALFSASAPRAVGEQFCYSPPNSTGDHGFLTIGTDRAHNTFKDLRASHLPPGEIGYLLVSQSVSPSVFGSGFLCLGTPRGIYFSIASAASSSGTMSPQISPSLIPGHGGAAMMPGDTWCFTIMHRDTVNNASTWNFTNAVSILIE